MKINSLLLPHPVLGRGDDVAGEFLVKEDGFIIEQDEKDTKLSVEFLLKNKTLEELISKKEAVFNMEVECPSTFYRKSFIFFDQKHQIGIEKNKLRDKVVVSFYITANTKIADYKNQDANEDYENAGFDLSEGDVLAFAGSISFNAELLWEDLRRIFNIIKIRKDEEREDGPALFDLNGNIIFISLSKKDYQNYDNYKEENENFTAIYHCSIVLPCLIFALTEMMSERQDDYKEWKWFRVLDSRRVNDNEIKAIWDSRNIPEIAQKLLGIPFERMFSAVEGLSTETGGE
ncbi:MAG TPA: hypothetical protein VMR77_03680 [Patescibacteria group bacterium]|nr:hypothetical protein [Patescibacteria group bacterium]